VAFQEPKRKCLYSVCRYSHVQLLFFFPTF
jgi:hypothetical protein